MKLKCLLATVFLGGAMPVLSAPWVAPDNLELRSDIQLLADTGVITAPVTTFPLMWASIAVDINKQSFDDLTAMQSDALINVRYQLKKSLRYSHSTRLAAYAATNNRRFTSFGHNDYQQTHLQLSRELITKSFAGKLQVNYATEGGQVSGDKSEGDINFDGSYIATRLDLQDWNMGNWVVIAGALDKWWGPGLDTSLIMSTNARPLPALSITRNDSKAFATRWLSWLGPWSFTAQMAKLEKNRHIPEALMWSSRASIRPAKGLELGLSWSFQWAGEGQPGSINDFFEAVSGSKECANNEPSCDSELNTFRGNHLAGYDLRWSTSLAEIPYAFYTQIIGEDGSPNGLVTDKAFLYGVESRFNLFEQRVLVNLEYTDTQVSCGGREDTSLDCFYEHSQYASGYRYQGRSIGSTYDNDAETLVLTVLGQLKSGNSWRLKLLQADLNTNDRDKFPNDLTRGNSVSKVAEKLDQLDFQYRFSALGGLLTAGGIITNSNVRGKSDTGAYLKYEYLF